MRGAAHRATIGLPTDDPGALFEAAQPLFGAPVVQGTVAGTPGGSCESATRDTAVFATNVDQLTPLAGAFFMKTHNILTVVRFDSIS